MPTFLKSVLIEAPVEVVFAFHERADALQLLSPSFPPVRIVRRTGGIGVGAQVELKIGPVRWIALHSAFEQNRLFEDRQIHGPFAKWIHRHEFERIGRGTRLTDLIEFQLPGGVWVNALLGWIVKVGLHQMFRYRHAVTKSICESEIGSH
jgi:ligand-binding SRPBCC domain-containing protein